MPLPLDGDKEAFPTSATPVSIVVCVKADNMSFHGNQQLELGRTEGAAVWPLSRMCSDVIDEVLAKNEPGQAHMTAIVLHTIMGLHVRSVSRGTPEPGAALFTLEDYLPCVGQFVSRQVTTLCERLPTDVTHVRPESAVYLVAVSLQIALPRKCLAAVVTAERLLTRVCSLMTCHSLFMVR